MAVTRPPSEPLSTVAGSPPDTDDARDRTILRVLSRWGLALAIAAYLGLALAHALLTPVFRAPDENLHLGYAAYVRRHGLPTPQEGSNIPPILMGHYPPLFAVLSAPFTAGVAPDWQQAVRRTHPLPASHPVRRAVLSMRLVSVLLSALVVIGAHRVTRHVRPTQPETAFLAAMLPATWPQFVFMAGSANPETFASALAALAFLAAVRGRWWISSAWVALAAVTRPQGLALAIPLALLAFLSRLSRWRGLLLATLLIVSSAVPLAVWAFRNFQLYDQFFLLDTSRTTAMEAFERQMPLGRHYAAVYAQLFLPSFVGRFGAMSVPLSPWLTVPALLLLAAGALLGVRHALRRQHDSRALLAAALSVPATLAALAIYYASYQSPQGRHAFVVFAPLAFLVACGLTNQASSRRRIVVVILLATSLLILSAYSLICVELPAYYPAT